MNLEHIKTAAALLTTSCEAIIVVCHLDFSIGASIGFEEGVCATKMPIVSLPVLVS
jgi:hypothetical protein